MNELFTVWGVERLDLEVDSAVLTVSCLKEGSDTLIRIAGTKLMSAGTS